MKFVVHRDRSVTIKLRDEFQSENYNILICFQTKRFKKNNRVVLPGKNVF